LSKISNEEKESLVSSIPYRINLNTGSENISIPSPEKIAVGEYDKLRYFIKIRELIKSEDTVLELRTNRKKDGGYSQPLLMPVYLRSSNSGGIIRLAIFLLALIFAGLDDIIKLLNWRVNLNPKLLSVIDTTGWLGILFFIGLLILQVDIFDFLKRRKK